MALEPAAIGNISIPHFKYQINWLIFYDKGNAFSSIHILYSTLLSTAYP